MQVQQMRRNYHQEKLDFKFRLNQKKFLYYLQQEDIFEDYKNKRLLESN